MPSSPAIATLTSACPKDWQVVPLAEVAYFQEGPGILAKDFREAGVPLLRLKCVEGDYVTLDGCNFLDPDMVARNWSHFRVDIGDLLISTSASLGRVSVVTSQSAGGVPYTGLIRFKPKDLRLLQGYLKVFLGSAAFIEQAESMASGSVIRHFGPSHIRQMAILLPPLDQQVAIGAVASLLDERLRLLRQTNTTLESIAQALFKSWFIDFDPVRAKVEGREPEGMDAATAALFPAEFEESALGLIPKGWRAAEVGEVFRVTMGQSPPGDTYNEEGEGIPFYQGRADFGFRFPAVRVHCTAPTRLAMASDVLVSVRAPVGDVNVALEECAVGRGVAAVGFDKAPSFALYSMKALRNRFTEYESHGTVFGAINKKQFEALPCVLPSPDVLAAFSSNVGPLDERLRLNELQIRSLTELRDTLLPRLISGKLRLPEAQEPLEESFA
ncbi:MAG: restriction endonuclease subunit S [Pseudomonadota bacterium]